MRLDEVPGPVCSTTVQGSEELELQELREQLEPQELEEDPDVLQAWEQATMGEEMGMEDEVLEDVDGGRRHQGDYGESEESREDKEQTEDSVPELEDSLWGPGHGC